MKHKPRIHKKKRLVCVHHESLGVFEVYKIKMNGTVNKKVAPEFSFAEDVQEAFRNMAYPFAGFKVVPKSKTIKAETWIVYVEGVWKLGNK